MEIKSQKTPANRVRVETISFGACVEHDGILYLLSNECPAAQCTLVSLKYGKRLLVQYGTLVRIVKAHIQVEE